MDASTKRGIIYVVAAAALVAVVAITPKLGPVASIEIKLTATAVEGDVLSIEVLPPQGNVAERKEAVVKLTTGETVRAFVPPACAVFVGQRASLSRLDNEVVKVPFYVIRGPE